MLQLHGCNVDNMVVMWITFVLDLMDLYNIYGQIGGPAYCSLDITFVDLHHDLLSILCISCVCNYINLTKVS